MFKKAQQVVVPVLAVDVVEHGAGRVAGIGRVHPASGQPPEQKAVDRAEGELAALGRGARTRHLVEQPGELGRREVGVDHEPGARAHHGLVAVRHQPRAAIGGAPVLPDDGAMHRPARGPLPQHDGLALVGDADRGDRGGVQPGPGERLAADVLRVPPDGLGIVLDPAVLRIVLLELALGAGDRLARPVEHDRPSAGGALIDRQDVFGHPRPSPTGKCRRP